MKRLNEHNRLSSRLSAQSQNRPNQSLIPKITSLSSKNEGNDKPAWMLAAEARLDEQEAQKKRSQAHRRSPRSPDHSATPKPNDLPPFDPILSQPRTSPSNPAKKASTSKEANEQSFKRLSDELEAKHSEFLSAIRSKPPSGYEDLDDEDFDDLDGGDVAEGVVPVAWEDEERVETSAESDQRLLMFQERIQVTQRRMRASLRKSIETLGQTERVIVDTPSLGATSFLTAVETPSMGDTSLRRSSHAVDDISQQFSDLLLQVEDAKNEHMTTLMAQSRALSAV